MKTLLTDLQHSIAQAPEHRHCHMTCEMVYVKRGRARFSIAGVDYTAGPGCLVLISPLEEHSVRALSEPYERYFATLSLPELTRAFPHSALIGVFRNRPAGFCHCVALRGAKPEADAIFDRLCREYAAHLPGARQMAEALLGEMLVLCYRARPGNFAASRSPSAARVDQVQQYIEEHFTQELTVTGLAERFFISPCHLTHSFKEQVGYSPKQYLRLLRLAYAKELMETTDLPVAEAAVRAGFADVNHFIRSFRETYGVPPGKWRNRDV